MKLRKRKIRRLSVVSVVIAVVLSIMMMVWQDEVVALRREEQAAQIFIDKVVRADEGSNDKGELLVEEEAKTDGDINYIGVVEIPKIGVKRGLVDMNDRHNNVSENVAILKGSVMPDADTGNLILAAHSGSSQVSFFRDLDKLVIGDIVNIYYKDKVYGYRVMDIYEEKKEGFIHVKKSSDEKIVTLTTCSNIDDDKQLVVVANFVKGVN